MKVKCKSNDGYHNLKIDNEYEVIELLPQVITRHFTFPRYVTVKDDSGNKSTCHAYRFKTLEGIPLDEYIKNKVADINEMEK